jgi:hypothetical protein
MQNSKKTFFCILDIKQRYSLYYNNALFILPRRRILRFRHTDAEDGEYLSFLPQKRHIMP